MHTQASDTARETLEAKKRIARRFLELISEHRIEELCAMVAPTWRMYGGPPDLPSGPDGIRALFGTFTKIEQKWTIEDVIAEDDRVVVRAGNVVVQDSFFGIDARGVRQHFSAMFMFCIADGLVQEVYRNADDLGRLLQLGARLIPAADASRPMYNAAR